MQDFKLRPEQVDEIVARLQGHAGWQLRHIPSRGYWIELQPDAATARSVIETIS